MALVALGEAGENAEILREREVCIGVDVKQRGRVPLREEDWASSTWNRTPQRNSASKLSAISNLHGAMKCLYIAVRGTDVANSHEVPATDGPYSVNDYNENLANWLVRNAGRE